MSVDPQSIGKQDTWLAWLLEKVRETVVCDGIMRQSSVSGDVIGVELDCVAVVRVKGGLKLVASVIRLGQTCCVQSLASLSLHTRRAQGPLRSIALHFPPSTSTMPLLHN